VTRSALVTGATGGIGAAIARMLVEEGFGVTLTARRPEPLAELADKLGGEGPVQWVSADALDDDAQRAVVDTHLERFGGMDVLVNSAGGGILAPFEEVGWRHVSRQLDLNLRAAVFLTKVCLPHLRAGAANGEKSLIVNVSSVAGKHGQPGLALYSAAKHGLVGFTEALNRELSADGIHSVVLCPSVTDTELAAPFIDQGISRESMIKPADLAEGVRFVLRSSRACLVPELAFFRSEGSLTE
jgi:NAD(P)-dependent dehydrogenase (short-subunit alcohol dehydrogenase family)